MWIVTSDYDQCKVWGTCDQVCTDGVGSSSCACNTGYTLQSNGKTCKASSGEESELGTDDSILKTRYRKQVF